MGWFGPKTGDCSCCSPCGCDFPLGIDFDYDSTLTDLDCECAWNPTTPAPVTVELRESNAWFFFGGGFNECVAFWGSEHRCCPSYDDPDRFDHISQRVSLTISTGQIRVAFSTQRMIGKVSGSASSPFNCCTNPDVFGDWMLFPSLCLDQGPRGGCYLRDIEWNAIADTYTYSGCPSSDVVVTADGSTTTGGCSGSAVSLCPLPTDITIVV